MTTTIHHATVARAARSQIELTIAPDGALVAVAGDVGIIIANEGETAAGLLDRALTLREEGSILAPEADVSDEPTDVEDPEADDYLRRSGSVVKLGYKIGYELIDGTCGDAMAQAFSGHVRVAKLGSKGQHIGWTLDYSALVEVGRANGVDIEERWGQRNPGMRRMNLSNVLRAMLRRGERVTVGGTVFVPEAKEPEPEPEDAE